MKTAAGFVSLFAFSSDSLKDSKSVQESDPVHPVGCEQEQAKGKVLHQNSFKSEIMNQLGASFLPVSASSGFQPDLCCLKKMLSASGGHVVPGYSAVISRVAGKDMALQICRFNYIDLQCIALLLLFVVVALKACGVILFLWLSWLSSASLLQQLL